MFKSGRFLPPVGLRMDVSRYGSMFMLHKILNLHFLNTIWKRKM